VGDNWWRWKGLVSTRDNLQAFLIVPVPKVIVIVFHEKVVGNVHMLLVVVVIVVHLHLLHKQARVSRRKNELNQRKKP
jgi:hypothetical protein